jgi:hypothetical protein
MFEQEKSAGNISNKFSIRDTKTPPRHNRPTRLWVNWVCYIQKIRRGKLGIDEF